MTGRVFLALLLPLLAGSVPVSQELYPTDCSDIYAYGQTLSAVYNIYPTGDTPVHVYCDMGSVGGQSKDAKWTVIQRRMDGRVNFYRPWEQYKKGFGNTYGEYWLGLENLYQLTRKRKYELRVDMQDFEGGKAFARYSTFSVESEANGYKLHVGGFTDGGAGDSLSNHNQYKFSTFDKDQDNSSGYNCAEGYRGAFWYNSCYFTNPNGLYLWGQDNIGSKVGVTWDTFKGTKYSLKFFSMKIRPVSSAV